MSVEALPAAAARCEAVLGFAAPYLIEKLLKERIVDTAAEGEALFTEVKRYLLLSSQSPDVSWGMYSARVDEAWHQFVLFTRQYADFCRRYIGRYVHHNPSNAPEAPGHERRASPTFEDFRTRYEAEFAERLPDVWCDSASVTPSRRVINDEAARGHVLCEDGMAALVGPNGRLHVQVNDLAREALEFIAATGAFYVRELPGPLTEAEKVGLVAALVEHKVLRVAP